MPRGHHANHKGRSRQFTPVDQLKQELDEGLTLARSQVHSAKKPTDESKENNKSKQYSKPSAGGGGVQCLIEISNPNRPADPNALKRLATQKLNEAPSPLRDRTGNLNRQERSRGPNIQKCNQVNADLARLALIRQEREAAAQKRLALAAKSKNMQTQKSHHIKKNDNTESGLFNEQ